MKRRDFLKGLTLAAVATVVATKASGLLNRAQAATFVTAGKLGYKEVAGDAQVKAGKKCGTCKFYVADAKAPGTGECTLKAMQTAMKAPKVNVKEAAFCNMWGKKA